MSANQTAFNKVYLGLKSQNFAQSSDPDGSCYYRNETGLKCAAGWLIPDSKYDPRWEGRSCDCLPSGLFGKADMRLIENLQTAHDRAANPATMQRRLIAVAKDYGLTVPEMAS